MKLILQRRIDETEKIYPHWVIAHFIATPLEQKQINRDVRIGVPIYLRRETVTVPNALALHFELRPLPDAGFIERQIFRYNRNPIAVTPLALFLGCTIAVQKNTDAIAAENALNNFFIEINKQLEALNAPYPDVVLEYDPVTQTTRQTRR